MQKSLKQKFCISSGIIAGLLAIISIFAAASLDPNFTWFANYVSDLGIGSQMIIFNYGLIISGIFGIAFAFGIHEGLKSRFSWCLTLLASVSLIGVGAFPESHQWHFAISAAFFFFVSLAEIFVGRKFYEKNGAVGLLSIMAGIVSLFTLLIFNPFYEVIAVFIAMIWSIAIGAVILARL
jgi:hypothetical membrane protein